MAEGFLEKEYRVVIDGEPVTFPEGTSFADVRQEYQRRTGGFMSGLSAGYERLKGSLGAIPDVLVGDVFDSQEAIDQAGREYAEVNRLTSEALPAATSYKDVIEAYKEDGVLGAIPDAYRFSAESIGQTLPYTIPSMFAGKVASTNAGLGIASYLAKATPLLRTAAVAVPPSVLKFGLGAAAGIGTLALQFFGDNMQRQYETAQAENPDERVTPEDLNSFGAALAAAPQAGMDYIVIALSGGIGRGPQIAAARSLKESLGAVGATAKASAFPTLGQAAKASFAESAVEFPTEMVQTILERAQAGLSISPQDAEFVEEMIATVAGTLPVAGAFGAYGTQRSYRANKKAYKDWEKLSEEEKVIRNDYEKRRESSVQAEYDNSMRMYEQNVKEVQNKFQEAGRESVENRRLIEQGVQEAKDSVEFSADDVFEAADSRNIKTDDKAFKAFVYRTTNGQTNDINEADQDALRAMRTILTGFTIQDYYDADTEEGVSVPSFTSEEVESVIKGLKSGSRITPEVVRKKLHEKFFSKAKGTGNLVDFTDSESSNDIASSIIEEMKMKGYAVEDKNGNVKARKPKYTESQYRDLMERAYKDGSINLRDYEQITGRFGQNNFESFLGDAVVRGDMPQEQSSSMGDGEFAPLVFRAAFSEDAAEQGGNLEPVVGPDGRPVIRTSKGQQEEIKRRLTAGNTVTEVVGANGYFIRDENGQIVGGATSKAEANKEANFLNENRAKYKIVDQATGNPTYGTKRKLNAIIQVSKGAMTAQGRASGSPDYTGVTPELMEGSFSVDNSKSEGFAVRQFLSPGLKVKDRETGELIETGESFGPKRPKVTEISFAPDVKTASSVEFEFAKEMMPGASNWDKKADEVGKTKRAELQQLFDDEGRQFRPPSFADVLQGEVLSAPSRPTEISKREKVLKEIPEGSRAKGEEVLKVIENKLKEANLNKALIGTVMSKIEAVGTDGEVRSGEGSYSPNDDGFRRIAISLDQIKDANTAEEIRIAVASIMDHEIVHAMRDLDLFTMQEWNVLSTSAYRVKNRNGVTFFDQASQDYAGNNTEYVLEEAVAEMYRQYYSVPEVRRQIAGQPRTLIERMAIFMEKLYNAMSGAGFVTAADAISGMKKIQAREAGEFRTIQVDRNPLVSQAIEVEEEAEEEVAGQPVAESVVSDTPTDPETRAELGRDPVDANADVRTDPPEAERFSAAFSEGDVPETILADKIDVSGMKKLPGGTTRDVYVIGNRVLKVAKNPRGLEQNASMGFGDKGIVGSALPEMFEAGKDYVVTENVPRNDKETRRFLKPLKNFSPKDFEDKTTDLQNAMDAMGLDGFLNYDLLWNDFTAFRNWGQRANGEFVLVDEGALNRSITSTSKPAEWAVADWSDIKTRRRQAKRKSSDARTEDLDAERFSESERLAFDRPYGYKFTSSDPLNFEAVFISDNGVKYQFNSDYETAPSADEQGVWFTTFQAEGGVPDQAFGVTGEEKFGALRVLGTIRDILIDFITYRQPQGVYFTSSKSGGSGKGARSRIYKRSIEKIAKEFNYDIDITEDSNEVQFDMSRKPVPVYNAEGERLSAVPLAPGTAPIPDGHFRFFHYTAADPKAIGREGIDISFARGHLDSEPDQIWATTEAPDRVFKTFVEFSLPPDDPRIGGTIGRERLGIDSQATFTGSINPEDIIAVHERWHDQHRYIMNNPKILKEVFGGKHDRLITSDPANSGRAVSEIKNSARSEERLSAAPNQGSARNSYKIPRVNDNARGREDEVSQRAVAIAEGTVEPQRLSPANQDKVNRQERRKDRPFQDIVSQLFAAPNDKTLFQSITDALFDTEKRKEWMARFRIKYLNQYDYLEKVTKEAGLRKKDDRELLASTNAASLALLADRANSVVSAAINNGAIVLRGGIARIDPTKKSLRQALSPLFEKDEYLYRDWATWMVANRAGRLIKSGKLTNLTTGEIQTINSNIEKRGLLPMFEQVSNDYEQWNDSLVNFMRDSGVVSEELAVVFKKYGDYIPFYRNMDLDGDADGEGVTPEVFKDILREEGIDLSLGKNSRLKELFPTLTDQSQPKKYKGGDMQLTDPLTGIMQNLRAAVTAGTKNLAAQRVMIDAVDAGFATEVFADDKGVVDPAAYTVRVGGEEKYFTTTDRLLIDTLTGFSQGRVSVSPFFTAPANFLRESVARSPTFILRNLLRDSMSVWVTSGANMTPIIDTMKKFSSDIRGNESDSYSILENSGVVGGYDYVFEPKKFEQNFRKKLRREGMGAKKGSIDTVSAPFAKLWDSLGEASQKSDAATRQVIYEDTLQTLLSKGVSRSEAESEAIFQAMETLNFSRRGNSALISLIMPAVPFLNARMQGLDVMYRAIRGRYKSNRDGENNALASFLARGGQIAAATLAYTLISKDDEEYKNATEAERDQNWIVGGVKIPIPFEVGLVFKTGTERITRLLAGDDTLNDANEAVVRGLVNTFEIPLTGPQALSPAFEVVLNKNWFTGRPVVPEYMSDRPPSEQYKYYTAEFAKGLGEAFNVSPLKIEHVLNGYSGTMGSYLLTAVDSAYKMATGKPIMLDWRSDEIPVIGTLFQDAGGSSGQMQRWNDFIFSVRGVHASLQAARTQDPDRFVRLNEKYGDVAALKPRLEKVNNKINELRSQRKRIYLSKDMTDDQKRRQLDYIDKAIKATLAGTERYRESMPGPIPFLRGIN